MIYILSWTTKKHQKILSRPLHSKLKKIRRLFKDLHRNLRNSQGKMEFKDFSRTSSKIQGFFKTVRTLHSAWQADFEKLQASMTRKQTLPPFQALIVMLYHYC